MIRLSRLSILFLALPLAACATAVDDPEQEHVATSHETLTAPSTPATKVAKPEPDPWKRTARKSGPSQPTDVADVAKPEPDPWKDDPAEADPGTDQPGTDVSKPEPDPWNPGTPSDTGATKK